MAEENFIKLDSFMKWQAMLDTGGQAKLVIQNGEVKVNGQNETRRGRKLVDGDKVTITDESGGVAVVTIADVAQSNGVIHVIDKVLLPKM